LAKCTIFRPTQKTKTYDSMQIFISTTTDSQTEEQSIVIQEKTPASCFSKFMANLLLLQNPEKKIITVYASKEQCKGQLETTLKNMNFTFYTVHV